MRRMQCREAIEVGGTPTGLCRDAKTGKVSPVELECIDDATGAASSPRWRNGLPYCPKGATLTARCPHGSAPIEIEDPITVASGALLRLGVIVGLIYLGLGYIGGRISRR
jgi:hypothetical protein